MEGAHHEELIPLWALGNLRGDYRQRRAPASSILRGYRRERLIYPKHKKSLEMRGYPVGHFSDPGPPRPNGSLPGAVVFGVKLTGMAC